MDLDINTSTRIIFILKNKLKPTQNIIIIIWALIQIYYLPKHINFTSQTIFIYDFLLSTF